MENLIAKRNPKPPIVMFKFGEPTMMIREDGTYVDDLNEWHERLSNKERKQC